MTVSKNYSPKLCHIPKKNLWYVTLNGKRTFLGVCSKAEAEEKYNIEVGRWMSQGRKPLSPPATDASYLIEDLVADYAEYLGKRHAGSDIPDEIKQSMRALLQHCAKLPVADFTQHELVLVRNQLVAADLCRGSVNGRINRIRAMFKWAAKQEIIQFALHDNLRTVDRLKLNEYGVRESDPIRAIERDAVDAILPHVSRQVAAMIEMQWETGMRPCEVVQMRTCDLDRIDGNLCYHVIKHKTRHYGRERHIPILPRVERILQPFLLRAEDSYLFDPRDADRERRLDGAKRRKTKVQPSQKARKERARRNPRRKLNEMYSVSAYRQAIARGCKKAGIPGWAPNRLRHSAACRIANKVDLLAASYILGHSSTTTTQIYAKMDVKRTRAVMQLLEDLNE